MTITKEAIKSAIDQLDERDLPAIYKHDLRIARSRLARFRPAHG
jgi:hypothetical protein